MQQLTPADKAMLANLQELCDDCKDAINKQSSPELKRAMQDACEKCKIVRQLVPDLMTLRARAESFVGELRHA